MYGFDVIPFADDSKMSRSRQFETCSDAFVKLNTWFKENNFTLKNYMPLAANKPI